MIYLDNAATTRVFDCAISAAESAMRDEYFNPNATYKSGVFAREKIEQNRRQIASAIGAKADEIVFTSCATEANNWVFDCGIKNRKGNVVITAGEHSSVYEAAMHLKNRGTKVRIAPLNRDGTVDLYKLSGLVDAQTALVSFIHVSNETGVINPVKAVTELVRAKSPRALIHCDGVQGLLKSGAPINSLGVDYYSASAHKLGAPKGIGLLYIRQGLNISPMILGGGQENGLRSGTQNTPYINAFAAAVTEFNKLANSQFILDLRRDMCEYFTAHDCKIIGTAQNSGYIICVCVPKVKAEILQNAVHDKGIVIGKGAACSGSKRGNRVLGAMGLTAQEIECCIRISMFVDTTRENALYAAQTIINTAEQIRSEHVG